MSGLSLLAALKAFDAIARAGSMTGAAHTLGLQQPTLSAHIARLEQVHGVELFQRRGRRLELTDFGRLLLDHTRRIFSAEQDAQALLLAAQNRYAGRLVIHAIGPYNVVPILRVFARRYPQVSLVVKVGDSRTIVSRILDHQGDVGLVLNPRLDPALDCLEHRRQPLVVFAAADHPLASQKAVCMRDLHQQRFVIREEGSTTRRVFEEAMQRQGLAFQVAVEMGSREAVREAVAQGMGLGVVADTAYVADMRLVKLPVLDSDMATHVHLICRRERRDSPLIAALFEVAAELRGSDRSIGAT
ncbi:LysR substrate-binding domain-containing protein [Piscinibacterium candidicorallinum]|jgi:aminoethylphosphonate catabolism LysR family transcriptional regulator|uniref:LysR substrate-binding domain-containing protein n=1 Tax=Piscinibacterium candidicorallinum TaxID=1793872 RepID=A0ABV7H6P1_9BURK